MSGLQPSRMPSASTLKTTRANQSAPVVRSHAYPPALPPSFLSRYPNQTGSVSAGGRLRGPLSSLPPLTSSSLLPPALPSSQPLFTARSRPLICTRVAECRDPRDPPLGAGSSRFPVTSRRLFDIVRSDLASDLLPLTRSLSQLPSEQIQHLL